MATDIATIGFGVETSQLEKGVATLNTFSSSAKNANSSAKSIGTAMDTASKVFAGAVAGMSKSILSLVSVTKGATVEQIAAAKEASEFAERIYLAAQAQNTLANSTQNVTKAVKAQYSAFMKMASSESVLNRINRLTGVSTFTGKSAELSAQAFKSNMSKKDWTEATGGLTRDVMPNRFNTANIAAQFQDIGVTAAMGMNPLLVALQQGTQLSAVLNSMKSPLRSLKEAFVQLINPVSLVSIGITALVVAGIQMVDWAEVAEGTVSGLTGALDFLNDNVEILIPLLGGLATAFAAVSLSSITAGFSTLGTVFNTLEGIIGKFVIGTLVLLTSKFALVTAAVTAVGYTFIKLRDYLSDRFGFDISFGLWDKLKKAIDSATSSLKEWLNLSSSTTKEKWDEFYYGERNNLDKLNDEFLSLTMSEKEKDRFLKQAELYGKALKAGLSHTDLNKEYGVFGKTGHEQISSLAKEYANLNEKIRQTDAAIKATENWNKILKDNARELEGLQLDKSLIGFGIYESTYEKMRQDLINKAIDGGITLDEGKIEQINQFSANIATLTSEISDLQERFDFAKSTTNSFFQDMRNGLWEGQSAWESFGNAVVNTLDKILSKMVDVGVDLLFQGIAQTGGFGLNPGITETGGFSSSGFSRPVANANGGVYTNGVYNSPTLFKFAKGGQFGVMGEAGPEAVMPLRRAPDGSLGVRADSVGSDVVVNVINNSNAQATVNQKQTSQGVEIDVMIDQLVAQKLGEPGTATNSSALALNNRKLIAR